MSDPADVLPSVGTDIATGPHTFHLLEAIGDGGYGSVFLAKDRENHRWAVKVENYKRSMLHIEVRRMATQQIVPLGQRAENY